MDANTKAGMKARMQKLQEEMATVEVEGQAAAGLVRVTISGGVGTRRVQIDPSMMQPSGATMLEDAILAAWKDAQSKLDAAVQARMQAMSVSGLL